MIIESSADNFFDIRFLDEFMMGHKGYIAGGCFKNIFKHEKIKDIDIFFEKKDDFDEAVEYFDNLTTEDDAKYILWYENPNVKAYKHLKKNIVIELCKKRFNDAESMISSFDFTIAKFAYYKAEVTEINNETKEEEKRIEHRVLYHDNFFEHLHLKRLVVDDEIPFPMSTFERMIRYVKYGYMPCRETKVKIATAIYESDFESLTASKSLYDGMD